MRPAFTTFAQARAELGRWLREDALPLWATAGWDETFRGFHEALSLAGPVAGPRRSRVQTRQVWVYATAAGAGLGEPYGALAERAWETYRRLYRRADGLYAFSAWPSGEPAETKAALYEQAFSLLALSALHRLRPENSYREEAGALLAAMEALRHPAGGWREVGGQPFQANAHMHLLEAALAWEAVGDDAWSALSDEVAGLAIRRFVDPRSGALREFFDADWRPLGETGGQVIEPGHQFEWATLLDVWARLRGRAGEEEARRLHQAGLRGVDPKTGVAANSLGPDLRVRDPGARLWAQSEHLRAAHRFGDEAQAVRAANGLRAFLGGVRSGAWRDKLGHDGEFVEEPAPATSLYHLVSAILPLESGRLPA